MLATALHVRRFVAFYDLSRAVDTVHNIAAGAGMLETACWFANRQTYQVHRLPILASTVAWGAIRGGLPDSRMLHLAEGLAAGGLALALAACAGQGWQARGAGAAARQAAVCGLMAGICGWTAACRMLTATRPGV